MTTSTGTKHAARCLKKVHFLFVAKLWRDSTVWGWKTIPLCTHLAEVVAQGVEHAVQHEGQEQGDEGVQVVRWDDALLREIRQRPRAAQHHLRGNSARTSSLPLVSCVSFH